MRFLDRYDAIEELGRGAAGTVLRARDLETGREVALKRLGGAFGHPERRTRLLREAAVIARLSHPGIVEVIDVQPVGEETVMVLEFVAGETLARRLERGPLAPAEAARLIASAARAVEAAHAAGIVHGDLHPGNVLLDPSGHPKLADFGLATPLGERYPLGELPAAAFRDPARPAECTATRADDIHALGALLHRCVTGGVAGNAAIADARLSEVCAGALDAGFESAALFAAALDALVPSLANQPAALPPGPAPDPASERTTPHAARRRSWPLPVLLSAATALLVLALAASLDRLGSVPAPPVARVAAPPRPAAALPPPAAERIDVSPRAPASPPVAVARPAPASVRAVPVAASLVRVTPAPAVLPPPVPAPAEPAVEVTPPLAPEPPPSHARGVVQLRHSLDEGLLELRVDGHRAALIRINGESADRPLVSEFPIGPGTHRVGVHVLSATHRVDAEMTWNESWDPGETVTRELELAGDERDWRLVLAQRH